MTQFVPPPVRPWRRIAATLAAVLAVAALAAGVVGVWNPWSLVALHRYADDPAVDLFAVMVLVVLAFWLANPVTSEAAQHRRVVLRAWLVALTVLVGVASLVTWGLAAFRYDPQVMARSGDRRAVAMVQLFGDRELHAFAGSGLGTRDMGSLGHPCGPDVAVSFTGPDRVRVVTSYGTFDLRLDPATGRPLDRIGATCSG